MINKMYIEQAISACANLRKLTEEFSNVGKEWNSNIDPDEVDYNFHDVISRITAALTTQEKWAFDLNEQLEEVEEIAISCDHKDQPHYIYPEANKVICKTCDVTYIFPERK